jgi:hypothetical protein
VLLTKTYLHTASAFGDAAIKGSLPNSGKLPFFYICLLFKTSRGFADAFAK